MGIEIGSAHTRAVLFDVVEDAYALIGSGVAKTSLYSPDNDLGEGIFQAISNIEASTGRNLLDHDGSLLIPSLAGGEGVDRLAISVSCGEGLTIVTFGQLADVSLESANKLAAAMYGDLVDRIGINDRRPASVQLDSILAANPDLIIFSGGTDGGASRSVLRMGQLLANALQLMPKDRRPRVLYCGNQKIGGKISELLDRYATVRVTQNVRPTIDSENLDKPLQDLADQVMDLKYASVEGLKRITPLCSTPPVLSNVGLGRVVRFLGRQYDPAKGVLGIDLGSAFSVAAYANHREWSLNTFSFGTGIGLKALLQRSVLEDFTSWLIHCKSDEEVRDSLWQRTLFPDSIAASAADLEIDLAITRRALSLITQELTLRESIPTNRFEPILVSGLLINRLGSAGQSLRVILDGLQPLGIFPLILDKHAILPLLGVIAGFNPLLAVQLLESPAFVSLATVVTVRSGTRSGSPLLHAELQYKDGKVSEIEVKQGTIVSLPLRSGETGSLTLKPLRHCSVEEINIFNTPIKVSGGVCGLVFDARGRPIRLPEDRERRYEVLKSWDASLGIKLA